MEGGRVRPSYGQVRYGVLPRKESEIVTMSVLQIPLPHHTIGRRNPRRFSPNAACVEEQGDDHFGGEAPSVAHVGWEGSDRNFGQELSV